MKKSIFAILFMLFGLFAAPAVYAEDLPEVAPAADDAPLPPLVDPAVAEDTSGN
jgi:hypothetical protein